MGERKDDHREVMGVLNEEWEKTAKNAAELIKHKFAKF